LIKSTSEKHSQAKPQASENPEAEGEAVKDVPLVGQPAARCKTLAKQRK
jgi:hypothetical protein